MKGKIGAIILGIVMVFCLIACIVCLEKIPAGYVGVVYNMNGGVDGEVLTQGWHLVAPTKKVTQYSIGIEQSYLTAEDKGDSPKDESFNIPTSDGKTVRVNIEFSYRFDEARVSETFAMFKGKSGEAIKDSFIKPKVIAWTQEVSANYPVTDIFGDKRTEINAELDTYLREKFDQYGIIIDTVNFTDISKDRTYVNVILSDDKEAMKEFRDFLAEKHITNVATDSYTLDWSRKSISITAYAQTKAQSRLIDEYIERSLLKCKRVIRKN